jgi:hypothetical protein
MRFIIRKSLPKVTGARPLHSSGFGPDIRSKAQIGASEWLCCGVRLLRILDGILIARTRFRPSDETSLGKCPTQRFGVRAGLTAGLVLDH